MRLLMVSSVLIGMLILGVGFTYVPHTAWCTYWDEPIGGNIGRYFTFSPPTKAHALQKLKEVVDHRTGEINLIPPLNITDHWKEKVAATECWPISPLQRGQIIGTSFFGLAFIAFLYRLSKKKLKT